jgi:hypothetical protein
MANVMKVDSTPIYLGYDKEQKKYYFYVIKQGVPRFLSYVQYFYWDKGPQNVLELKAVPPEIEQELINYLEGSLGYEFFKQRRNSKEQSVRKIYRLPERQGTDEPIELPTGLADGRSGRAKSGLSVGQPPSPEPSPEPVADACKRSTRRVRSDDSETHSSVKSEPLPAPVVVETPKAVRRPRAKPIEQPAVVVPVVEVKQAKKPKRVVAEVVLETAEVDIPQAAKQNSKMLKALERLSKSEPANEVEVSKKLKKVIEPKPLVPNEATSETNRGRPKHAPTLDNPKEVTPKLKAKGNGSSIRPEVNVETTKQSRVRKPK